MIQRRPLLLGGGLALGAQAMTGCGVAAQRAASGVPAVTSAAVSPTPAFAQQADSDSLDGAFTDAERQRVIPWRLRLPAGDHPVAWVIFSHGLGGSLAAGTAWARAWAQAGIATLHLQHAGSDIALWRQGVAALRQAASGAQLWQRALDVRAAIDQVQRLAAGTGGTPSDTPSEAQANTAAVPWWRLRADAIGVAGHSFGAHTTLAVAGQRYAAPGATLADPRPRAFAAFSPSPGAGQAADQAFGAITRPVLCLTGSADADPLAPADAERASRGAFRRQVFDGLPPGDKAELWLDGADHMGFSGQPPGAWPAWLARRPASARDLADHHQRLVSTASTLWWRAQLLGDAAARRTLADGPAGLLLADAWRRG